MMIEEALYTFLSTLTPLTDLVGDRIYPSIVPQDTASPYVAYYSISDEEFYHLGGDSGISEARFQIELWSDTHAKARELAEILRLHMSGFGGYFGTVKIQRCVRDSVRDRTEFNAERQGDARYAVECDYMIVYEKDRALL